MDVVLHALHPFIVTLIRKKMWSKVFGNYVHFRIEPKYIAVYELSDHIMV